MIPKVEEEFTEDEIVRV